MKQQLRKHLNMIDPPKVDESKKLLGMPDKSNGLWKQKTVSSLVSITSEDSNDPSNEFKFTKSFKYRQQDTQKVPICELISGSYNLNSGHQVPHSEGQENYLQFDKPPECLPMIPKEKIVEKKFIV